VTRKPKKPKPRKARERPEHCSFCGRLGTDMPIFLSWRRGHDVGICERCAVSALMSVLCKRDPNPVMHDAPRVREVRRRKP
jgi:hypothetical protein